MITVRYFAAAAEAAGTGTEEVPALTAAELRAALVERHGDGLRRVLERCALLHEGERLDDPRAPLRPGGLVDVLPPFAGG
ncbi:MoaD/ThiS family protein [Cellulosimicrobium cellulans]|uniref:MoaD/ThiS family protein n=1 Tax=Cellulosimicrobium cellulans TaxID=1710 RepID=UPI00130EE3A4|nr:MoaD/ThiS family protein [Cellulosimicrobium cellulans]